MLEGREVLAERSVPAYRRTGVLIGRGFNALRTLGPLVLAEASAALGDTGATPTAMMRMYFFKDPHAFRLDRFMTNELPPSADVRLVQTLATA